MEGFEKIELDSKDKSSSPTFPTSAKTKTFIPKPKILLSVIGVLFVLIIISGIVIIAPLQKTIKQAKKTYAQVQVTIAAVKKQNIELASSELDKTRVELQATQKNLSSLGILKAIPVLSWYYNDASSLVSAGFDGLDAAKVLIDAVEPYSDVLGLKGKGGSFVLGTASQRIETAVRTMGTITPHIDDIAKSLVSAKQKIDSINPSHYPSFFGGAKIKKQLESLKQVTAGGVTLVNDARPLIKILPNLLGEPNDKKYLILFQNNNELRPTGGFITAYAVFRLSRGVIHVDRSGDIYTLDAGAPKPKAPAPILKYLPNVTTLNLRDSNLSPDFIESMKTFNSIYEKTAGKVDVDGIIAIDSHVLTSILKILDDEIIVDGIRFTTKNESRCDCPQIIYELERLISTPKSLDLRVTSLAAVQAARKDILGSLLYALMDKSLKSSPKLYWGPLFQDFLTQVSQKHVLLYLYDKDAQAGVEALNVAGRIKPFEGDYLHINEANFGGAKSNLFVQESVSQKIDISSDGVVTKAITINYKNPHEPSDCNLERGGLCLNAVLRNWIRIYVPKGSQLITSQGSEVKLTSYEELGKTVFEGFLTVRPKGIATFTISYRLPFKITSSLVLPLLIQKQPGTDKNEYQITVNGRQMDKFPLLTDKEIKIKI